LGIKKTNRQSFIDTIEDADNFLATDK